MKKMLAIVLLCLWSFSFAKNNSVNVYIWAGYLPNTIIDQFEQQTGITLNISTFESNDELYAKLASANNHSGYDVVVPSANFIQRMISQHMLQPIDKGQLSNFHHLNSALLNKAYDPNNRYSVPYLWGLDGIAVNRKIYPKLNINDWPDLWAEQLNNQLLFLKDPKTLFEIALKVLDLTPNSRDPKQIQLAYQKLLKLLPNIKIFNTSAPNVIIQSGDVGIGVMYNGDAYLAQQNNKAIDFIFPKSGVFAFIDSMVIPKNAPHLANAYQFINFILTPNIAKAIALHTGYSTPNKTAESLLPNIMQNSTILYPPATVIDKIIIEADSGSADSLYFHYWFKLRLAASQ